MANQEQYDILKKQGVEAWNQWRKEHPKIQPDLSGADLRRTHLEGADFIRADFRGAYLSEAHLEGANLYGADLSTTAALS